MVYMLGKKIGQGSDGVVFELLEDKKCNKVIKFIQGENFGIKNYIEYYILYNLDSNYITNATKIEIEEDGLLKIVQPKAIMDMGKYILENNINISKKIEILFMIAECIKYLHFQNILHGDIKPTNILYFEDSRIKLSDFNLSKLITSNNKISQKLYTINFRAPEIDNNKVDIKSDIWALGCTFYEIYYDFPYFIQCDGKKFFHIKNSKELNEENNIFNDLIKNMIEPNLEKRFDIEQVLNHYFFKNMESKFKGEKKEILSDENFIKMMEKNMDKYYIEKRKHRDIFISKILNNYTSLIDKNYKKIEKLICSKRFDFYF